MTKNRWFVAGDLNGFFGLMFDNLTVLSFLAAILIVVFKYPADIVYTKMFPGTALGVLFGNHCYTGMALRLRKRTGRADVTAMPLGLDTPSTIAARNDQDPLVNSTHRPPSFLALFSRT